MSVYYCRTSAVASKFDANRLFVTADEARTHDRAFAAWALGEMTADGVRRALDGDGYETLRRVVDFLDDELPRDIGSV